MAEAVIPAGARAGMAVVTLPAEIDMANADRVGEDLQAAFASGVSVVVADMTATPGVSTLIADLTTTTSSTPPACSSSY